MEFNGKTLSAYLTVSRDNITPKMFGAVGNGVADDTEAIKNAISYCKAKNKILYIPAGTYNLTDVLTFDGLTIVGEDAEKCILRMVAQATARERFIECFNKIIIKNVKLQQSYLGASGSMVGLFDCNDSILENCIFLVDEGIEHNGSLELFRSNNNIRITNCRFFNYSKQNTGGVWVRNGRNTVSKNIIFDKCVFEHMTKDEVVAVWGWNGTVEDVVFRDCSFETLDLEYAPTHMIRVGMSGTTRNVLFDNCTIKNNSAYGYTIKSEPTSGGVVENIKVNNCNIGIIGRDGCSGSVFGGDNTSLKINNCTIVLDSDQNLCTGCMFDNCDITVLQGGACPGGILNNCRMSLMKPVRITHKTAKFTNCVFDFNGIQSDTMFVQPLSSDDEIRFYNCELKNYVGSTTHFCFTSVAGSVVEFINCRGITGTVYSTVTDFTLTIMGSILTSFQANGTDYTRNIYNNFVNGAFIASGLTA